MHPIVLAAGRGSRLGSVTADKPKLFVEIDGETIYERQVRVLKQYFDELTVVLGHGFTDRDPAAIDARLDVDPDIDCHHVVLEPWAAVENAASLEAAIDARREAGVGSEDLLIVCGDVLVAPTAVERVLDGFETDCRPEGYNAVACFHGIQDEMTAVRFDESGMITAYGAIAGHQEAGVFVLHEDHVDAAAGLLADNRDAWFPIVFEERPSKRVQIPEWTQHEINTPEHLDEARHRVPVGRASVSRPGQ